MTRPPHRGHTADRGTGEVRTFPRRYAATQRFTLGAPRSFAIAPDGSRVVFIRSSGGDDPVGALWVLDLATAAERCVADPRRLGAGASDLPPEERARRERAREQAGGIVGYATDRRVTAAVFTLGGQLFHVDLLTSRVTTVAVDGPVVAPRLSPDGAWVSFVRERALWVVRPDGTQERRLAGEDTPEVSWGLPDFVAAEEMGRMRGYWWGPDSDRLAVTRVDETPVLQWHLGDPIDPAAPPALHRYPAAGTTNAVVTVHVVDLDGSRTEVVWDRAAMEYVVDVAWRENEPLTLVVQSRDQRHLQVLTVAEDGATTVAGDEQHDPWVEIVAGFPGRTPDGRTIHPIDEPATRRIGIAGSPVTPEGLQVRRLVEVGDEWLTFTASGDDPTAVAVWRCRLDGSDLHAVSATDGVADAAAGGEVIVVVERRLDRPGATATVHRLDGTALEIASHAETPALELNATAVTLGARQLRGMLLLPRAHDPDDGPLPVLLDPYGGPHAQRALRSHNAQLQSQWFADAGFAVLVVDGRGSPGRGPAWEQTVAGDLATAPLEDQVDALTACAAQHPGLLDLHRVAIKGWSFGGFLAALAVLRRPDVFHAAIAGAPVTDWSLYDTHYTERYLGTDTAADSYRRSSLLDDAAKLTRPLLLIHGLSDDNVVAAHTLRLSRALLEAGRPHTVLPLSGVTHMTPQEVVAENLLHLQLHFLRAALGVEPAAATGREWHDGSGRPGR
jgi:dipeptidyl-peptidase-4